MTNLSTLQQNTALGLSEEAQTLYLRGCDRNERRALLMASEWQDRIEPTLGRVFNDYYSGGGRGAYEFIRERHFRRYFPDGRGK